MLLWSMKSHSFWKQNFLRILLTSLALFASSLSSARAVRLEMATEIPSWSTMRPMSTISSAHSREKFEFRRLLVPTWMIIESGFRLIIGLMWSAMSFVVQPGKLESLKISSWYQFISASFIFENVILAIFRIIIIVIWCSGMIRNVLCSWFYRLYVH